VRGHFILSSANINGNVTNASIAAMVNGKIIEAASFNTAAANIMQIKTIIKKTARPE